MSIQLQLRRGTTVENDSFTGAQGEITVDTDNLQLYVHDGQTPGGAGVIDPVVAFQVPTSENNYTWYRKYASGWVEQGGRVQLNGELSATNKRITFPVVMENTQYTSNICNNANPGVVAYIGWESTTEMSVGTLSGAASGWTSWEVRGMAAN